MTLEEYRQLRSQKAAPLAQEEPRVWSGSLNDARPGDVLRDKDGDVWVRTAEGAICLPLTGQGKLGEPIDWHAIDFGGDGGAEECFGPFEDQVAHLAPVFFKAAALSSLPEGVLLRDKDGDFWFKRRSDLVLADFSEGKWSVTEGGIPFYRDEPFTWIANLTKG